MGNEGATGEDRATIASLSGGEEGDGLPSLGERASEHPDSQAVDDFAELMRRKLAVKRAEGYGGWDNPAVCTVEHLADLLISHLPKGDPVDVANFAMMLFHRNGGREALAARAAVTFTASLSGGPKVDAWEWLSGQTNLSLDYDWPNEGDDGEWRVHRVRGSVNDREWELVCSGATALEAVREARSILSPDPSNTQAQPIPSSNEQET